MPDDNVLLPSGPGLLDDAICPLKMSVMRSAQLCMSLIRLMISVKNQILLQSLFKYHNYFSVFERQ